MLPFCQGAYVNPHIAPQQDPWSPETFPEGWLTFPPARVSEAVLRDNATFQQSLWGAASDPGEEPDMISLILGR